jgi:hypothetical protein
MLKFKTALVFEPEDFDLRTCAADKILELPTREFENLLGHPMKRWNFISANKNVMYRKDGVCHCLLVLGEGYEDGVLIQSDGYEYPRFAT